MLPVGARPLFRPTSVDPGATVSSKALEGALTRHDGYLQVPGGKGSHVTLRKRRRTDDQFPRIPPGPLAGRYKACARRDRTPSDLASPRSPSRRACRACLDVRSCLSPRFVWHTKSPGLSGLFVRQRLQYFRGAALARKALSELMTVCLGIDERIMRMGFGSLDAVQTLRRELSS